MSSTVKTILWRGACCAFFLPTILAAETESATQAAGNIGLGPISPRTTSPFHLLLPDSTYNAMVPMPKGARRVDFMASWGNVWNRQENEYLIDGEWIALDTRLAYAVRNDLQVILSVPVLGRTGGFSDSIIQRFHNAVGFDNDHRDEYPKDKAVIDLTDPEGGRFQRRGDAWGIGDLGLSVAWLATPGDTVRPALSLHAGVAAPTGDEDELQGLGEPAIVIGFLLAKRFGASRTIGYLGAAGTYTSQDEIMGVDINKEQGSALAGLEFQWKTNLSLLVQVKASSPFSKDYKELNDPVYEFAFGCKWRPAEKLTLEVGITENMFEYHNGTDLGLHAGCSWIF